MRKLIFEEINDELLSNEIYNSDVKPLIIENSLKSIRELVDGLSNVILSYKFSVLLEKDLDNIDVLMTLKTLALESIPEYSKIIRILNSAFLLTNADVRSMLYEVVKVYIEIRGTVQPLAIIYETSVNPAPMALVEDIYNLLNKESKDKASMVYADFLRIKSEIERKRDERFNR